MFDSKKKIQSAIGTTIHDLAHALGFSEDSFRKFIDDKGDPYNPIETFNAANGK